MIITDTIIESYYDVKVLYLKMITPETSSEEIIIELSLRELTRGSLYEISGYLNIIIDSNSQQYILDILKHFDK